MNNIMINKNTTYYLKGVSSIGIILHHIYQYTHFTNNMYFSLFLQLLGYLCVCIFFFCSGYGLGKSKEKEKYLKNFLRNKILPLYIFEVFLIIITYIYYLFFKIEFSFQRLVLSFLFGDTIIIHGWYLQTILIFYFLFYISFNNSKKKYGSLILFICILIYSLICYVMKLPITWYEGSFCFEIGILLSICDKKIKNISLKNKIISLLIFLILFIIFLYFSKVFFTPLKCLASICWNVVVLISILLFNFKKLFLNNLINKIGFYSLELYVAQGFILYLYKINIIKSLLLFLGVLLPLTLAIAFLLNKIFVLIKKKVVMQ